MLFKLILPSLSDCSIDIQCGCVLITYRYAERANLNIFLKLRHVGYLCRLSEDCRFTRREVEFERFGWQGPLSVSLLDPLESHKTLKGPSWKKDLGLKPYRTHYTGTHTLCVLLSETHSSWGKYIKHLIASFSTQGIILERICLARTYFADSWRMNHREREIIGQDKERTSTTETL